MDNLAVRIWFRAVWLLLVTFWLYMLITTFNLIDAWGDVVAIGFFSMIAVLIFGSPALLVFWCLLTYVTQAATKRQAIIRASGVALLGNLLSVLLCVLVGQSFHLLEFLDVLQIVLVGGMLPATVSILSYHKQFNISNTKSP